MRMNLLLRKIILIAVISTLVYLTAVLIPLAIPIQAASEAEGSLPVDESPLNPAGFAYELNPAPDGTLWVSDRGAGEIRAYAADGSALQVFSGLGAVSDARAGADGRAWFVDQDTNRLGRLDPQAGTVDFWALPPEVVSGFGTALDDQGGVWASDFDQARLYRFNPTSSQMCSFDTSALASGGSPYLAIEGQALWLSDLYNNAVLRFDLQTYQLTRWKYYSIYWDFEAEGLSGDGAGGLWFADSNNHALVRLDLITPQAPRLLRYRLPSDLSTIYKEPVMLALQGELILYSGLTPAALGIFNPAAALPSVFTPEVSSATLEPTCETLVIDESRSVTSGNLTPVWEMVNYSLNSPDPAWQIITLPGKSYPWGVAVQDNQLWAVDNGRDMLLHSEIAVSVTACVLEDEDGDLETEDDRSPLPGLPVFLRVEGVRQYPEQLTEENGCYTWTGLAPLYSYGLESAEGRDFLTPMQIDFDPAWAGASLSYNFILAVEASTIYLPVVIR